jgi:hypothetical protein
MEEKLAANASKNMVAARGEKDNNQMVRLWLNQITPDNQEKKQGELRVLLFGDRKCLDEEGFKDQTEDFVFNVEKQEIVVKTIFRKAQSEHSYAGFYSELCAQIVRLELQMKGLEPKRTNIRNCDFRKKLLEYCRESFEALLNAPVLTVKKEDEKEEARFERELKLKEKLFGNIEFVGELFKLNIVTDTVLNQVFISLLGIGVQDDSNINDNTIEAAIKLMNKVGHTLEARVNESGKAETKAKLTDMMK